MITVRGDEVTAVTYADNGTDCYSRRPYKKGRSALPQYSSRSHTFDDLFDRLESCTDTCVVQSATFHPTYGFPVKFTIVSVSKNGIEIEDASCVGVTSSFEIL